MDDPVAGGTRQNDLKDGIMRWQSELQNRGITINVQTGDPPPDTPNLVRVRFVDPNSTGKDSSGDQNAAQAGTRDSKKPNGRAGRILSGFVDIANNVSGPDFIKNLGAHEFTHALGLADEPTEPGKPHNVMDHEVDATGSTGFTASDKAELNSVYANVSGQFPRGKVTGMVEPILNGFHYDYHVSWLGGPTIPFVQIGTNGRPVSDIRAGAFLVDGTSALATTPDGFFLFDPRQPASAAGYLEDVPFTALAPDQPLGFLTFVNTKSPLGPLRTSFDFSFDSPVGPGTVLTYASGENFFFVVGPHGVPDPSSTLTLLSLGTLGLFGYGWQRPKRR